MRVNQHTRRRHMPIAIFTDTAANLPAHLVKENNITVIPLTYIVDGEPHTCADAAEFDGAEFYQAIRNGAEVKTSQITPQIYIDYMTSLSRSSPSAALSWLTPLVHLSARESWSFVQSNVLSTE